MWELSDVLSSPTATPSCKQRFLRSSRFLGCWKPLHPPRKGASCSLLLQGACAGAESLETRDAHSHLIHHPAVPCSGHQRQPEPPGAKSHMVNPVCRAASTAPAALGGRGARSGSRSWCGVTLRVSRYSPPVPVCAYVSLAQDHISAASHDVWHANPPDRWEGWGEPPQLGRPLNFSQCVLTAGTLAACALRACSVHSLCVCSLWARCAVSVCALTVQARQV